jgi:selenocysteine lyase/cysteine desulfurase
MTSDISAAPATPANAPASGPAATPGSGPARIPGTRPGSAALSPAGLAAHFPSVPGYLNAATMGLPPIEVSAALRESLSAWETGTLPPVALDGTVNAARAAFARIVGVPSSEVAVGSQVSVLVGTVATGLPPGSEVLTVEGDFTSVVFPFLVQAGRGVRVRQVPLERLAEEVREDTSLIAYSLVQSADGRVADSAAIGRAADRVGALTLCDTSQAVGWLPVSAGAADITVCGTYKWLCTPRGVAFMTVGARAGQSLTPVNAGWYAGESVWDSVYGPQMNLAADARRFDVSPAWMCWAGAVPALELFASADPDELYRHGTGLADGFRERLGLAPTGSAIVALDDPDGVLRGVLDAAGCTVAGRAGRVRLSFHVWNDAADVDRAAEALAGVFPPAPTAR